MSETSPSYAASHLRVIQGGKSSHRKPQPITTQTVFEKCRALSMSGKKCCVVLHLDDKHRITERSTFSSPVSVKEVFRSVSLNNSHEIIFVRTAATPEETSNDFVSIERLAMWGRALKTRLVDYVVVAPDGFISLQAKHPPLFDPPHQRQEPARTETEYQPVQSVKPEPSPEQLRRTAIGAQIKKLRMEQGMKQKDFAAKSGVRQPMVSSIELGHKEMSSATAEKIAAALGVQPQELLNLSEDATTNAEAQKEAS